MFLPPYCPELNSIESLWSVVKGRIKTCLLEHQYQTITQEDFQKIMLDCLNEVQPEQQKRAARFNNRDYIYLQLSEYLDP